MDFKNEFDELEEILKNDIEIDSILQRLGFETKIDDIYKYDISNKLNYLEFLTTELDKKSINKKIVLPGEYKIYMPESFKVNFYESLNDNEFSLEYKINYFDENEPWEIEDKSQNKEFIFLNKNSIYFDSRIILSSSQSNYSYLFNPIININENSIPILEGHYGIRYSKESRLISIYDIISNPEKYQEEVITQIFKYSNLKK